VAESTLSAEELRKEQELIAEAKERPEAFRVLYDRYYPVMFRYVFNKLREKEQTADLTSQIFLKALLHLPKYKNQGVPFSAWLYRIAKSEVGQYFRDEKKRPVVVVDEALIAEIAEEGTNAELEHAKARLAAAVQHLALEEVHLLDLRFQEDKPFKEIGLILGITENNAKVRTYRVLDKLRRLLRKEAPAKKPGLVLSLGSRFLNALSG
jgi:RNA polymerase sigma-70 factor, ECF subfamily